ncbi:hypothetical protein TraAM80_03867, partial [Trypanosoma rangeli]
MFQPEEEDFLAIKGELWMCADSEKPYKVGAGRGSKNYVCIEDDRFYVYSTRSTQSRLIKEVAFRSMKRVAWFTHNPKPPVSGGPHGVAPHPQRGARGAAVNQPPQYYYMVLEFIRDNTVEGTERLAKRERVVLCTENAQDFQIWQQFVEMYKCTQERPPPEILLGRSRKRITAALDVDHDETTSEDVEDKLVEWVDAVQQWRERAISLLNEASRVVDPAASSGHEVSISVEQMNNRTWKKHADELLDKLKNNTANHLPGSDLPPREKDPTRIVELWNALYDRHVPNSSPRVPDRDKCQLEEEEEQQQKRRVKYIDDLLLKSKLSLAAVPLPSKAADVSHLDDLEKACLDMVRGYESRWGAIETKEASEGHHTGVVALADKIKQICETLRRGVKTASQEEDADNMLAELRAARRALEVAPATPRDTLQEVRQNKNIERVAKEALLCFTKAVVKLLQLCYEEYASLRDHILSALRGSNAGGDMLVINSAHFEVVKALEEERRAAKSKQEALETLMQELELVRRERDVEIGALEQNFSRAKNGWGNDLSVLQAKLTALQSSMTRTAVVVPAENAVLVSPRGALYGDKEEDVAELTQDADRDEVDSAITRWATQLVSNGDEVPGTVVAMRLQRFFCWALRSVVPLCAGRDTNCILELVMWALGNHLTLLQTAARVFGSQAIGADNDEARDLCSSIQALHDNHIQLEQIVECYASVICPSNITGNVNFTEVRSRLQSLRDTEELLENIHTLLETTNENIVETIMTLMRNSEDLDTIKKVTGHHSNVVQSIVDQRGELQHLKCALQQLLDKDEDMHSTTEELLNQLPELQNTQKALKHTQSLLEATSQLAYTLAAESILQQEEFRERLLITHDYYARHPLHSNQHAVVTEASLATMINSTPRETVNKLMDILKELRHSKSLLGEEDINTAYPSWKKVNNQ